MNGRIVEGGSTLTQQLSKNLFLINGQSGVAEKTIGRKIQEAMLSIQIERNYTKEQILTMYCNLGYMGHGQYGFAAAAEFYFGKTSQGSDDRRSGAAGSLATISQKLLAHCESRPGQSRRDYAIDRMVAEKKITAVEGEKAKKIPTSSWPRGRDRTNWHPTLWRKSGSTSRRPTGLRGPGKRPARSTPR